MIASFVLAAQLVGTIPPALAGAAAVLWLSGDPAPDAVCEITPPNRWECRELPQDARGVVVIIGSSAVSHQAIGPVNDPAPAINRWGRLVVLSPGVVMRDDLSDVRMAVWRPERAQFRTQVIRFAAVEETGVRCVRVSDTAFWLFGDVFDPDAFVKLEGDNIAATRIPVETLADGPPDLPVFVNAELPQRLSGRVETGRGEGAAGAEIELFAPLPSARLDKTPLDSSPTVRVGTTQAAPDGAFSFERLPGGPFLVAAIDATLGRGSAVVTVVAEPLTIRLTPPARAEGRVVRNRMPVAGARVRFVPSVSALIASTDPKQLASEEQISGEDGRFSVPLPPVHAGELQVLGPDGASARVGVPDRQGASTINIGDVTLPEHRRLTIRLLEPTPCTLAVAGPVGKLGLTIVEATGQSNVFWLDIPEPGDWALEVRCRGYSVTVEPALVVVPASGPDQTVDVRVTRPLQNVEPP